MGSTACTCCWTARPSGLFGIEWYLVLPDPDCTAHKVVA